jgi:hypothetical protein
LAPYSALAAELNFCNKGTIGMRQFNAGKADFLRNAGRLIDPIWDNDRIKALRSGRRVNKG